MVILVTGADGFVGRNLQAELAHQGDHDVIAYDKASTQEELDDACRRADFVFHLAGVNRPKVEAEFMEGNYGFTSELIRCLEQHHNHPPILISSSIQAELDNPYGVSKRKGEEVIFAYGRKHDVPVYVFRLANLFGKWSRPNYNSVVATWCYNVAHDLPLQIDDPAKPLQLVYIDDVIKAFLAVLKLETVTGFSDRYYEAHPIHCISLGELAATIRSFRELRTSRLLPDLSKALTKKLYSTYLSYLAEDDFSYPLLTHADQRGSFTEFIRTVGGGQVSINVSKPGIAKGDHWHHTKNEKFLVVSGKGEIRFRQMYSDKILSYPVRGDKLEVVDIPVGYTHSIINTGDTDLVTVMWANENFDPANPDTYALKVDIDE